MVTRRPAAGMARVEQKVGARETVLGNSWRGHLRGMDRALGQSDVDEARRAWKSAHLAAVESFSWEGLIATGRASLRIGDATEGRTLAEPAARRAFFAALYRACRENSVEGILRAAEAFADLGDREVVEECLGLAELQVDGEQTRRRVAEFVGRLGVRSEPANDDVAPAGAA